jgi:hypothetical protein
MKLTIEINIEGAAFEDYPAAEIDRILNRAGAKISNALGYAPDVEEFECKLLDYYGNSCGSVKLEA